MADIALITGAVVAILTALSAFIVKVHLKRLQLCCVKATCLSARSSPEASLSDLQYDDTNLPPPPPPPLP